MKRLTSKQIKLVKVILTRLGGLPDTTVSKSDLELLEKLFRIECNGIDIPEEQDWSETVTAQIAAVTK